MLKNKNPTNNSFSISKCCLKNNLKGQWKPWKRSMWKRL
jgi:hypothetical protein